MQRAQTDTHTHTLNECNFAGVRVCLICENRTNKSTVYVCVCVCVFARAFFFFHALRQVVVVVVVGVGVVAASKRVVSIAR